MNAGIAALRPHVDFTERVFALKNGRTTRLELCWLTHRFVGADTWQQ